MINENYSQPYKTYKPTNFEDGMLQQMDRFRMMNGQRSYLSSRETKVQ